MLRLNCPPEPWLDLPGANGSKTRAPSEVSMWDPHLGCVVEMDWIGRVVTELCFRSMGMIGSKRDPGLCKVTKESKSEPICPKFRFSLDICL